jgi:lauroyl/myristoyl acyltransferase
MAETSKQGGGTARIVERKLAAIARPAMHASDIAIAAMLIAGIPLSALLPDSAIKALCRVFARIVPSGFRQDANEAQIAAGAGLGRDAAREILARQAEARLEALGFFLKSCLRPGALKLDVEGTEHVETALKGGKGAVVWIADFVFGSEGGREAFYKIGRPLSHMSRPEHGFSDSTFGVNVLNRVRLWAENRFLHERIIYRREAPSIALGRMKARLAENGLVSILACAYEGRNLVEADFLKGKARLAGGGPGLAASSGCPVLPVYIVPNPAPPHFKAIIGAPLDLAGASREDAVLAATKDFLKRMEPHVLAHPHLWRGWPGLASAEAAQPKAASAAPAAARLASQPKA